MLAFNTLQPKMHKKAIFKAYVEKFQGLSKHEIANHRFDNVLGSPTHICQSNLLLISHISPSCQQLKCKNTLFQEDF